VPPSTGAESHDQIQAIQDHAASCQTVGHEAPAAQSSHSGAGTYPGPSKISSAGDAKRSSKQNACLTLLARPDGATIEELQSATGWQSHSVRGFLACAAVKIKLGLTHISSKVDGDVRRYRIVDAGASGR